MTRQRVLFVTPPYHAGVVEVAGKWVPLGLVALAGATRAAGHEVAIYDAMTKGVGFPEIEARIREYRPDVVCVSVITSTCPDALLVVETAKKVDPRIATIAGGIHATFMAEEMFATSAALDVVVLGEGEVTVVELLDALAAGRDVSGVTGVAYRSGGRVERTGSRPFVDDLDALPYAYDLLDWSDYTYFILPGSRLGALDTSRGCDKACTFCSQQKFWKQSWRARSPAGVVREIERMKRDFGVSVVLLTDDYPTLDRARWERILDLLVEKDLGVHILMETRAADILRDRDILGKYRRAGIIHIYVGIEATDQSKLDLLKKELSTEDARTALRLLDEVGIITETSMILGFPDDTRESIDRTLELVRGYNPDFAHFLAIAPWPYADIYPELAPFVAVKDYRKYNLVDPVIRPKHLSMEEIDQAIVAGYRKFYMGKLAEILGCRDEFKRQYMLTAMRRMMSLSFIQKKLGMLGGQMPEEIRRIIGAGGADAA